MPKFQQPLSPKERVFVAEYLSSMDGTIAATTAGYKCPSRVSSMLLKRPHIKREIAKGQQVTDKRARVTTDELVDELDFMATRDIADLCDDNGTFRVKNLREIPERLRRCIDGFKVRKWFDQDGNEQQEIEVKLVSKLPAIELSLKYRGALVEKHEHTIRPDVEAWHDALNTPAEDTVEKAIEEMKKLPHVDVEQQPDGSYEAKELLEEIGEGDD